jgi:glycosyltransferase involved in cell wall biosynthesis
MDIHGITIVRDEADVIAQSLRAATAWCDHIYVLDNGSTDGTWEIVQDLARTHEEVIPHKKWQGPFTESLRGEIFRHFRPHRSTPGDWWCRLDADEFYIDDPRIFLRKVPATYGNVWSSHFNFYFTGKDLRHYEEDPSHYTSDTPIEERLRYYRNNWSELRFFRDDGELVWQEGRPWPDALGRVYPVRIWLKHYQYRSPEQIERRLKRRADLMNRGENHNFFHEVTTNWITTVVDREGTAREVDRSLEPSWRDRIVPPEKLDYDAHDQQLVHRPDLLPNLPTYHHEWMLYSRPGQTMLSLKSMDPTPVSSWVMTGASWMRNQL